MKTVFMFTGQGSQYIGMAKDFYEKFSVSRECFEIASKATGIDVAQLVFEENDKINITEYTQIAILTAELAMLAAVKEMGINQDYNCGLSLGEYSALVASGVLQFDKACELVRKRGIIMANEVPMGVGTLHAIIGVTQEQVIKTIDETIKNSSEDISGLIGIANYNCPGQYIITGRTDIVELVSSKLSAAGAKKVIPLKVSGPFHSQMLVGAGEKLGEVLEGIDLDSVKIPYITNYDASIITSTTDIKELLKKQVYSPVKFQQSIEHLIELGCDTFVDIGPGDSLGKFVARINENVKVINIEKVEDLEVLYGI